MVKDKCSSGRADFDLLDASGKLAADSESRLGRAQIHVYPAGIRGFSLLKGNRDANERRYFSVIFTVFWFWKLFDEHCVLISGWNKIKIVVVAEKMLNYAQSQLLKQIYIIEKTNLLIQIKSIL